MAVEIADAPDGSDIADWPTAADAVAQQFAFSPTPAP